MGFTKEGCHIYNDAPIERRKECRMQCDFAGGTCPFVVTKPEERKGIEFTTKSQFVKRNLGVPTLIVYPVARPKPSSSD